jgi:hypothetical protein
LKIHISNPNKKNNIFFNFSSRFVVIARRRSISDNPDRSNSVFCDDSHIRRRSPTSHFEFVVGVAAVAGRGHSRDPTLAGGSLVERARKNPQDLGEVDREAGGRGG